MADLECVRAARVLQRNYQQRHSASAGTFISDCSKKLFLDIETSVHSDVLNIFGHARLLPARVFGTWTLMFVLCILGRPVSKQHRRHRLPVQVRAGL